MAVPPCATRPGLPMLRRQLVLRTMAAAAAAATAAGDADGGGGGGASGDASGVSGSSGGGGGGTAAGGGAGKGAEIRAWFDREYAACLEDAAAGGGGAGGSGGQCGSAAAAPPPAGQQPQQAAAVPHLLTRTATLQQAGGPQLVALRGHAGAVRCVAVSPDGRDVLTASDDGSVQVGREMVSFVCACLRFGGGERHAPDCLLLLLLLKRQIQSNQDPMPTQSNHAIQNNIHININIVIT